ncbi:MAG TPA: flagellar hook capping FlgD N-terminal domain-containing protein, partial [Hyphomicrobium sp.]|nr:flagellar hook capping FlgD N-terminal domain-containing protein [Hyphomicrobium sp.]
MDVGSSTATTGTQQNTTAQSTGASTLGYDAFLKLLVAQMQ